MIKVDHLYRRYGDIVAVDDVSFTIDRGEVVGLLGHNGAGKTTIMKMLTGYLEPTSGSVTVDSMRMGPDTAAIQRRIGYLPENCPLWPEMTVIDYLDYQAALHGIAASARGLAVARAIGRTALSDTATQTIQTLSRGYRQRVGVAQALLHAPDIVILDEPTNGLDPTQIRHMRDLIRELARNATVILSTHILQEVQAVCERVLIMRAGRLAIDARIETLSQATALFVTVGGDAHAILAGVAGVESVEAIGGAGELHRYRLKATEAAAPAVARALAERGLALYALQPQRQDLESVFASINEQTATGAAHA